MAGRARACLFLPTLAVVVVCLVYNHAGSSVVTRQIFTAFRTEYRVFQAIFPGKSGQL
jgi:hypothetical protein